MIRPSIRRARGLLVAATVAVAAFAPNLARASTTTIQVAPGTTAGWRLGHFLCPSGGVSTGSASYVSGPGTPALGAGSVGLTIGSDSNSNEGISNSKITPARLDELTTLSYQTYVAVAASNRAAPLMTVGIDRTGDAVADDSMFFSPQRQGPMVVGTWQTWDPLTTAGWFSRTEPLMDGARVDSYGRPFYGPNTLAHYLTVHPDARIIRVGMGVGCSATGWVGFEGAVDALTVGVKGNDTVYDFEPIPIGTSVDFLDADRYLNREEASRPPASVVPTTWETGATDVVTTSLKITEGASASTDPACGPFPVAADGSGYLSRECAVTLDDGLINLVVTWTDSLGNSWSLSDSLIKDTAAPSTPTITFPADGQQFSPGTRVVVTGTATPGITVRLVDFGEAGLLATADADGTWSIDLGIPSERVHALSVTEVDAAGNASVAAEARFIIDRLVPVISRPAPNQLVPAIFTVSGTGKPTSTVELYEGSTPIGRVSVTSTGNWSGEVALGTGVHSIRTRAVDPRGPVSGFSDPRSFIVDAGRPTVAITAPASGMIYQPGEAVKIDGTATDTGPTDNFGVARVEVTYTNELLGARTTVEAVCATCGLGADSVTWTHSPSLTPGFWSATANSFDVAGNRSASASVSFIWLG